LFNFRGGKEDFNELKKNNGGLNYIVAALDDSRLSKEKKLKYFRFFISKGCGVNDVSAINGARPLHIAASDGNAEIVELLLENGADPLLKSDPSGALNNMTPLEMAERFKKKITHIDYTKVIEVLRKAEENAKRNT
jgi:ankyrin repeat protein